MPQHATTIATTIDFQFSLGIQPCRVRTRRIGPLAQCGSVELFAGYRLCAAYYARAKIITGTKKAHLCGQGVDPETLRQSHAYISGPLPVIIGQQFVRISGSRGTYPHGVMPALRKLASKIELLAPAVTQGGTVPANCEYPWKGPGGLVHAPCDHNFQMDLLHGRAGLILLKALYTAAQDIIASH